MPDQIFLIPGYGAQGGKAEDIRQREMERAERIAGVYAAAMDYGSESVMAPTRLEKWPVTAAFVRDPDGYLVQLMQRHA